MAVVASPVFLPAGRGCRRSPPSVRPVREEPPVRRSWGRESFRAYASQDLELMIVRGLGSEAPPAQKPGGAGTAISDAHGFQAISAPRGSARTVLPEGPR